MIVFDIKDRVTECLGRCKIFIIPTNDTNKISGLNYVLLEKLKFKDIPDGYELSMVDIETYIKEFYVEVLSKLDPIEMLSKLKGSYLASNERADRISKRHIFTSWLNIYSNEEIREMSIDENGNIKEKDIPEFISNVLETIIKENKKDMKGFESLRALYLYEKSEKYEEEIGKFRHDKVTQSFWKKNVDSLREEAFKEEKKYISNKEKRYCKNI